MSTEKIDVYLSALPEDRKGVMEKLIAVMKKNLPKGFSLDFSYGMIGFCVPHSIYPKGYHCDSKIALPFVSIASQKNFIALYHMGIYAEPTLLDWFVAEYPKHVKSKLDMGKSCIRFKKMEEIPFDLIGALMKKMSPQQWIDLYESKFVK
ncbi:MAG: hypothetical protein RL521_1518 [Bacteroidota bacterium]|jgi:uncharacterized protein YdhG (YjbR/CyaY superfamily)